MADEEKKEEEKITTPVEEEEVLPAPKSSPMIKAPEAKLDGGEAEPSAITVPEETQKLSSIMDLKDFENKKDEEQEYREDKTRYEAANKPATMGQPYVETRTPGEMLKQEEDYNKFQAAGGWTPADAKYLSSKPEDLTFINKVRYLAEEEAKKQGGGARPDYVGVLWKAMNKDPSLKDSAAAALVRQDIGKGARGLAEVAENFARGYSGGNWTTAQDTRLAQEAQQRAIDLQKEQTKEAREYDQEQKQLDRNLNRELAGLQTNAQKELAAINYYTQYLQMNQSQIQNIDAMIAALGTDPINAPKVQALRELQGRIQNQPNFLAPGSLGAPTASTPSAAVPKSDAEPAAIVPPTADQMKAAGIFKGAGGSYVDSKNNTYTWNGKSFIRR